MADLDWGHHFLPMLVEWVMCQQPFSGVLGAENASAGGEAMFQEKVECFCLALIGESL